MNMHHRGMVALFMTLMLLAAVLCIGAFAYFAYRRPVPTDAPPAVAAVGVDEASVRLPDVSHGAVVSHNFLLTNESEHALSLAIAALSSSDLKATVSPSMLPTGEKAIASLVFEVGDVPEFDVVAEIACRGTGSGDLLPTIVPLRIAARVTADQGLIPSAVRFREARRGEGSQTQEFRLSFPDDAGVEVLEVQSANLEPGLTVRLDKRPELASGKAIYSGAVVLNTAKLNPGTKDIDDAVRIIVGSDATKIDFRLGVFGTVVEELRTTPSMLFWSRQDIDTPIQVTLDAVRAQPVEIIEVSTDKPELLRWTIKDNQTATPTLEIICSPPEDASGAVRSKLTIQVEYGGRTETATLPVVIL